MSLLYIYSFETLSFPWIHLSTLTNSDMPNKTLYLIHTDVPFSSLYLLHPVFFSWNFRTVPFDANLLLHSVGVDFALPDAILIKLTSSMESDSFFK